jgi:microcystin-dependent protein
MSGFFIGQLKILGFSFAPKDWAQCNGQQLPINQNQALFSILGTTYGGNGQTTFALPNLQGRMPVHWGSNGGSAVTWGEVGGVDSVTLGLSQMPQHSHSLVATTVAATSPSPTATAGRMLPAAVSDDTFYTTPSGATAVLLEATTLGLTGGSQAHTNIMPTLAINFSIALVGIFPARN